MSTAETTLRSYAAAVDKDPSEGLERTDGLVYSGTLSDALTLTNKYPRICKLDPGGANRNVTLEAEASSGGLYREITNTADAAENLVIKDDSPATIATIRVGETGIFYCDGTTWRVVRIMRPRAWIAGASTAAAGTTTADAGVLPAGTSEIYPVSAADGTKGVRIHADDQVTGRELFIGNNVSNQILKVYGPSGAVINGAAADAAYSSASGKGVLIRCLSGSGNTWLALG